MIDDYERTTTFAERDAIEDIPSGDLVHEIVRSIVDLVPVSRWTFARFKGETFDDQFASSDGAADAASRTAGFLACAAEFDAHASPGGPALTLAARPIAPFAHALVLFFADNRTRFGMLSLFRTADAGPFQPADLRALRFALDAASDTFSEARLMNTPFPAFRTVQPIVDDAAYYILDRELAIVFSTPTENARENAGAPSPLDTRLPPLFADAVRTLTADWTDDRATRKPGIAFPVPFIVLRVHSMSGDSGWCVSVAVERLRQGDALIHAAAYYRISPRELQVLSRLLEGSSLVEIAQALAISSSTVQDHIKRLIEKSRSGNRSEMIANMFRHDTQA